MHGKPDPPQWAVLPAALGLALLCPGTAADSSLIVEAPVEALQAVVADGVSLAGLSVLLDLGAPDDVRRTIVSRVGSWALHVATGEAEDVRPDPVGTAPSTVVLDAPPGGPLPERVWRLRRAAASLRASFPCGRVLLRASAHDPLLGHRDALASVSGLENRVAVGDGWADLLAALPEVGTSATLVLREPRIDVARLRHVLQVLPPPWFRIGALLGNVSGRRLAAEPDGLRVLEAEGPTASADVAAGVTLSAAELLARHQASIVRRERLLPRLLSHGTSVVVFEVPGLAVPMTLSSDVTLEEAGSVRRVAHRGLRLNGLHLGRVPRLPLVTGDEDGPAPLGLAIDEAYAYAAAGRSRLDGVDAHVLEFTPRVAGVLPSGRALLHPVTFELVRLETVAAGRQGPFVSSRQVEERAPRTVGEHTLFLTSRLRLDQVYDAAGHRTPVRRELHFVRHEVPAADALPVTGDVVVALPAAAAVFAPPATAAAAARGATRVRTVAAGVLLDPGIDHPLPFLGGSWSELDLFGSGSQLSAQLGGAFARVGFTRPEIGGPDWHLRAEAAGAIVEYNDRSFREGVERHDEVLRQRPLRATLLLERRLGSRLRARIGYELSFTRLRAGADTAATFRVPRSPLTHGLRTELHGERGPFAASLWSVLARRASWHAWGHPGGEGDDVRRDSLRGGLTLSRVLLARPRAQARLHLEGTAGRGLDRFSRFGFDAFENRLAGYATNALRHDGALVGRLAFAATPHSRLRLAGFVDGARVRHSSAASGSANHGGAGLTAETPLGPLVLSAEWARGFAAPTQHGPAGPSVVRVAVFAAF
jgi:hypothetical protein